MNKNAPSHHFLSLTDSLLLKCISILVIALHNYIHWTNNIGENEMGLDKARIFSLLTHIKTTPTGTFNYLISYFGWYFITPFIFISGYGLTIKLQKQNTQIFNVIILALFKTILLLMIGVLYIYLTGYTSLADSVEIFIRKLSTIDNLFEHSIFLEVGPWWYFSLAIQLYIMYPIALILVKKYGTITTLLLSYLMIYLFYYYLKSILIFGTAIGHLPELILGIALATNQPRITKKIIVIVIPIAMIIFILSNKHSTIFPLTYLTFLILFLTLFLRYKNKLNFRILFLIGTISPYIFLLNGPLRKYTMTLKPYLQENFSTMNYEILITITSILHVLATIFISIIVLLISKKPIEFLNNQFKQLLSKI